MRTACSSKFGWVRGGEHTLAHMADGLRSHLIVAFLDLYEIARLQVAFSNLDRDLRDPDSRCELMASSPGLERATVASAQTLEHLAIASRPRLTFSFQPGTHPEEDLILITNPAPSASARLLRRHKSAHAKIHAPCGCDCGLSGARARMVCDMIGIDGIPRTRLTAVGRGTRAARDPKRCQGTQGTITLQLELGVTTRSNGAGAVWARRARSSASRGITKARSPGGKVFELVLCRLQALLAGVDCVLSVLRWGY